MAVEFNEPQRTSVPQAPRRVSSLTGLILKLGLAKTEAGARVIMLVIAFAALALAYGIFMNGPKPVPPVNPADYDYWPR